MSVATRIDYTIVESRQKIVNPPQVLVRGGGIVPSKQQFLCYDNDTTAVPVDADAGADCTRWTQVAIICLRANVNTYKAKVWLYYANAGVWVHDATFDTVVATSGAAKLIVDTAAASAVYVQITDIGAGALARVVAEADK